MELKVPEDIEQAVVPIQDQVGLWYLKATLHHQLQYFSKVTLTQWHMVGVDVSSLESCKKQLSRCYVIAIGTQHHDRYPQSLKHFISSFSFVIGSSIPLDYCRLSPMRVTFVKLEHQLLHKQRHHALIGV